MIEFDAMLLGDIIRATIMVMAIMWASWPMTKEMLDDV